MVFTVFDIETDGLLNEVTKIHCLSYQKIEYGVVIEKGSLIDPNSIVNFIISQEYLIGHNIIKYDLPVLTKLLGVTQFPKVIDTLGLSWYLYCYRDKHGLESWGETLDVKKPVVKDWKEGELKTYIHRCETDVEINTKLFMAQMPYLYKLYGNSAEVFRMINYCNFKLECLKIQEQNGILVDKYLIESTKQNLEFAIEEKVLTLQNVMPKSLGKIIRTKPKVMHTKAGFLSTNGKKWAVILQENNLPDNTEEIREAPNPNSHSQLKAWLDSLGWKPVTFKESKATGKKVPQVSLPNGGGICSSVKELYEVSPDLKELEGLFMLSHRLGLVKSFIATENNGRVIASANGFTNTMRLQHNRPVVNLPAVSKPYGKEIRGILKADENCIFIGADISGLEDNTKQHYMFFFDPDYVIQMRVPGFDPHIDIGLLAGLITPEQAKLFEKVNNMFEEEVKNLSFEESKAFAEIKKARNKAKIVNFSGVYGAGPPKIAETLKCDLEFAKNLHTAYWKRNKAVKDVESYVQTRYIGKHTWLYNPISRMYLYLKAEKDKFSTLNQSSGVYVFDTWVRHTRKKLEDKFPIIMQYHDEILMQVPNNPEDIEKAVKVLKESMQATNQELKLNIEITISIEKGYNYAECH